MPTPFRRIGLLAKTGDERARAVVVQVARLLRKRGSDLQVERLDLLGDELASRGVLERLIEKLANELHVGDVEVGRNLAPAVPELPVHLGGELEALLGHIPVTVERLQAPLEQSAIGLLGTQLELSRED